MGAVRQNRGDALSSTVSGHELLLAAAVILFAGAVTALVLVLAAGGMSEALRWTAGARNSWVSYASLTLVLEVALPAVGWGFLKVGKAPAYAEPSREIVEDLREVDTAYLDGRISREEYLVLLREFGRHA
jgi:hypothetical protein